MKVPETPEPMPSFFAEYAWRDFATKKSMYSTDCPITSQVEVSTDTGNNVWKLQTFDIHGLPKTIGGDEFTVYYTEEITGTTDSLARIHDEQDGTYTLDFFKTPNCRDPLAGVGMLRIVLVFSCNLGMVAPPLIKLWSTGGFAMTRYDIRNMTAPSMQDFVPQNTDHAVDLSQYDEILVHGNSTMNYFAGNFPNVKPFPPGLIMWNSGTRHALYENKVNYVMLTVRNHMRWMVETSNKTAFVYGSSAWDINIDPEGLHGVNFENQLKASRLLIETFRKEFTTVDAPDWPCTHAV